MKITTLPEVLYCMGLCWINMGNSLYVTGGCPATDKDEYTSFRICKYVCN